MHDNSLMLVIGGHSELRVRLGVNIGVSTDHGEFHVVGATMSGLNVVVVVIVVVDRLDVLVVMVVMGMRVDIVVRVSIIGDQGAASIVTGKFDLGWVDGIERGNNSLAVNLDHSLVRVDCGGSELWVNVISSLGVSSCDVELHTMAALGLMVLVVVVMVFVVLRFRMSIVVSILVSVLWLLVATAEGVPVMQLGVSASENRSASVVHLGCESELLAVKDKGILVGIEISLSVSAFILSIMDKALHSVVCCVVG